jgi:hypothetical protein
VKVRVVIRGFIGRVMQFAERVEIEPEEIYTIVPALAEKHAMRMALTPHMLEIEFLDEKDLNERFFRIGTDPTLMKKPIALDLTRFEDAIRNAREKAGH